jgi:alpha-L-arabinofuranosidase
VTQSDLKETESKRVYSTSSYDTNSGEVIIKLVNATNAASDSTVELVGAKQVLPGKMISLGADDLEAVNTFDAPNKVAPRESAFAPTGPKFNLTLPANSFTILRVGVRS